MADLALLAFKVDTGALDEAHKKLEGLGVAVADLAKETAALGPVEENLRKTRQKAGDAAVKLYEQEIDGAVKAANAVDRLLKKQEDTLGFMRQQFSKGQSSVLAFASSIGATADQLDKLKGILDNQRALIGGDAFDKSIGGLKLLQNELKLTKQITSSLGQENALSKAQLRELGRDIERVTQLYADQGRAGLEVVSAIGKLTEEHKEAAAAIRAEEAAQKAILDTQDKSLRKLELLEKAQRDLRIETEKQKLLQQGFSSATASAGAKLSVDGLDSDTIQQLLQARSETEKLAKANRDLAMSALQSGKQVEQFGDAAVVAYNKSRTAQTSALERADQMIAKLKLQAVAFSEGSSRRADVNALIAYRNALDQAGVSSTEAARRVEQFNEVQKQLAGSIRNSNLADGIKSVFFGGGLLGIAQTGLQLLREGARAYIEIADNITNLRTRLNILSDGTINFNKEFSNLVSIANSSRVAVKDVSTLFARLVPIMPALGRGTKDAANVTDAFSKILLISGTSASEASSALLQFSQALGKGKLDGDEFRSVAEATPEFLRILEKQLGVTRGELFKMAEEGRLTADVLINTLGAALPDLAEKLANVPLSVGQAFTILKNNITEAIATFDQASGLSSTLAAGILAIAEAIKAVNDTSPEFKKLLLLLNPFSGGLVIGQGIKNFFGVDESSVKSLDNFIAKQQKAIDVQKQISNERAGKNNFYDIRAVSEAEEKIKKLTASVEKYKVIREKLGETKLDTGPEEANLRFQTELTNATKEYQAVKSKLYATENKNNKDLQAGLAAIQKQRELGLISEVELNKLALDLNKEYGIQVKKEREKGASFRSLNSSNELAELQKQLNSELSAVTQFEKTKQDLLKSELDAGIITKSEYAQREIELARRTEQTLIDLATKRQVEGQKVLDEQARLLIENFNAEVARNRGRKDFTEKEKEAYSKLIAEIEKLTNVQNTLGVTVDNLKKKASDSFAKRETEAVNGLVKALNVLRDEYKSISIEESKLAEKRKRDIELENRLRFASPEDVAVIRAQSEEFERLTSQLNKTSVAYLEASAAALEQRKAILDSGPPTDDQIEQLKKLEKALTDVKARRDELEGRLPTQVAEAGQAALTRLQKDNEAAFIKGVADGIDTALFEGGKAGRKKLRDLIVAELRKPITLFIQANVRTLLDAAGITNTGESSSNSGIGKIFEAFDSFNSNVGFKVYQGVERLSNILSQSESPFIKSLSNVLSDNSVAIGQAAGAISGAISAVSISNALSGGYKTGIDGIVKAATLVGGAIFGPIAGVVAGAFNRLFGRKLADTGVQGQFGGERGFEGQSFEFFKGGLFRSDKTRTSPLDEAVRQSLSNTFKGIQTQVAVFATSLGLNADSIADYTTSIKISTKGLTEEQITEKFNEEFKRITEEISNLVVTAANLDVTTLQRAGELVSETLQRLSVSLLSVNPVLDLLNQKLFDASIAGGALASSLVDSFGTLEDFNRLTSSYYQNFFSEQERTADTVESLTEQFKTLNLSLPSTRDGFRQLVEAQDLSTDAGRNTFAALLNLSEAFASVTDETKEAESATTAFITAQERYADAIKAVESATNSVIASLRGIKAFGDEIRQSIQATEQSINSLRKTTLDNVAALEEARTAADSALTDSISNLRSILEQASDAVLQAEQEVQAARLAVINEARQQAIQAANDVAQAESTLNSIRSQAADNLRTAIDSVNSAESAISDILQRISESVQQAADRVANAESNLLDVRTRIANELVSAQQAVIDAQREAVGELAGFAENIRDFVRQLTSNEQGSTSPSIEYSQALFNDTVQRASAGDVEAFGRATSDASNLLDTARSQARTFAEFRLIDVNVRQQLNKLAAISEAQKVEEETQTQADPLALALANLERIQAIAEIAGVTAADANNATGDLLAEFQASLVEVQSTQSEYQALLNQTAGLNLNLIKSSDEVANLFASLQAANIDLSVANQAVLDAQAVVSQVGAEADVAQAGLLAQFNAANVALAQAKAQEVAALAVLTSYGASVVDQQDSLQGLIATYELSQQNLINSQSQYASIISRLISANVDGRLTGLINEFGSGLQVVSSSQSDLLLQFAAGLSEVETSRLALVSADEALLTAREIAIQVEADKYVAEVGIVEQYNNLVQTLGEQQAALADFTERTKDISFELLNVFDPLGDLLMQYAQAVNSLILAEQNKSKEFENLSNAQSNLGESLAKRYVSENKINYEDYLKTIQRGIGLDQAGGTTAEQVNMLYREVLGRDADSPDAARAYAGFVDAGEITLEQLRRDMFASLEYLARGYGPEVQAAFNRSVATLIGAPQPTAIPAFANGGVHMGGIRLVGEDGPEIEVTGNSRISNARQTQSILLGANMEMNKRLDNLAMELREMRAANSAENIGMNTNLNKIAKIIERADNGDSLNVNITNDLTVVGA